MKFKWTLFWMYGTIILMLISLTLGSVKAAIGMPLVFVIFILYSYDFEKAVSLKEKLKHVLEKTNG